MNSDGTFTPAELLDARDSIARFATINGAVAKAIGTSVLPILPDQETQSDLDLTFRAILVRFGGWNRTLSKCNSEDVQAAVAGARVSFELHADVAVLFQSPARIDEMLDWERSAKLKHCESRIRIVAGSPSADPADLSHLQKFVDEQGTSIRAMRAARWPDAGRPGTGRHPERWYGLSLPDVLRRHVDIIGQRALAMFDQLQTIMNWFTHGTSLVFVRGIPTSAFADASVLSASITAHLALKSALLIVGRVDRAISARVIGQLVRLTEEAAAALESAHVQSRARRRLPGDASSDAQGLQ